MLQYAYMQGNQKSKILYMITKGNWGGAQVYVHTLATSLPHDLFEPVVVTGEGNILPTRLRESGIRTYTLSTLARDISLIKEIRSFFEIMRVIRQERPDVLHLNSPKAGGLGALAGRLCKVPHIIYTAHGWSFNEARDAFSIFLIKLFSWIIVILSHTTIVIAQKEKEQILEFPFIQKEKIVYIPNGVRPVAYKTKEGARAELLQKISSNVPQNTYWIGTIAELHANKGIEYMLGALSKISFPFVYIVMGAGEEREKLEHLIDLYKLKEKVFLVGFVKDASTFLPAFDVFVLPSIKEGLPYTVLEAGLAEIPVIATRVGGVPDIIEHHITGLCVDKGHKIALRDALVYMEGHPNEVRDFAKNLKEKVTSDFSETRMVEKTIRLYTAH